MGGQLLLAVQSSQHGDIQKAADVARQAGAHPGGTPAEFGRELLHGGVECVGVPERTFDFFCSQDSFPDCKASFEFFCLIVVDLGRVHGFTYHGVGLRGRQRLPGQRLPEGGICQRLVAVREIAAVQHAQHGGPFHQAIWSAGFRLIEMEGFFDDFRVREIQLSVA